MKIRRIVVAYVSGFVLLLVAVWFVFFGGGPVSNCDHVIDAGTPHQTTVACTQMSPEQENLMEKWKTSHPSGKG
jgi:hypothetical protein